MGTYKVSVCLGYSAHSDLIVSSRPESGEGRAESDGSVSAGNAHDNSSDELFSDETLDESVWENFHEID
jgi:hypothetical protein